MPGYCEPRRQGVLKTHHSLASQPARCEQHLPTHIVSVSTFNVLLLTHLASSVEKCTHCGAHQPFFFEGNNLVLKKVFKETQQLTHHADENTPTVLDYV